jgi:signal transduction histidine kinase
VASTALAVVLALIIELPLDVDTNLFLVAAVAISAWYGGRAAGLLSAALSSIAIAGLFIPRNATLAAAGLGEVAYIGAFLIVSLLVSSASGALHAARRAAEFRVNQLRAVTSRLERALQFSEEQSRRMERLLGVIMALPQAMTVADIGKVAVERGLDVLGATRGALFSVDGDRLIMIATKGYPSIARSLSVDHREMTPVVRAVTTRDPVTIVSPEQLNTEYARARESGAVPTDASAILAFPLISGEQLVGGLELAFSETSAAGVVHQAFSGLMAQAIANAILRARSFDVERDRRQVAELQLQARSDVLGIVAHDLRNPINIVGSTLEMLNEPTLEAKQRQELMRMSTRALERMERLVADLLDATLLQAGRLSLELAPVDVQLLLRDMAEAWKLAADKESIDLMVREPATTALVNADKGRILQCLGNLVHNAIKFTPAGGQVSVGAELRDHEVIFDVTDDGPGIPDEDIEHLFERFWQGGSSDHRGVGLGLTITKSLVEAHGGRIWVESSPGRGSRVAFSLPRILG